MRRTHEDQPALITTAPESGDDEFEHRRRRYAWMMAIRALCVIAAAMTYHVSLWLALGLVLGGAILPWCAVILANDGPPKKRRQHSGYVRPNIERALPSGDNDRTVEN